MSREVKVVRFDLYPQEEPTGYAVGFSFSANNRSGYTDTLVTLDEAKDKSQEEIVSIALSKVKTGINTQLTSFESKSPVLGMSIDVSELDVEDEPIEE